MLKCAGFNPFLYLLTAWFVSILWIGIDQFVDPDLWGRLSIAALYFQSGHFPFRDVFSYSAAQAPWIDHEWLTGCVFYQILGAFGEIGFLAFKYTLILSVFALLFGLHRKVYRAGSLYAFYGLLAVLPILSIGFYATIRAQAFSFLFFTLMIFILEKIRLQQWKTQALWVAVPLGLLWGNFHGGFVMGLLLLACYATAEWIQTRFFYRSVVKYAAPALSTLCLLSLLNPYGPAYMTFLWKAWTLDRSHIAEWHSLQLGQSLFIPLQCLLAFWIVVLSVRWLKSLKEKALQKDLPIATIVLAWLIVMSIFSVRFQTFLAIASVAYLPLLPPPSLLRRYFPENKMHAFRALSSAMTVTLPLMLLVAVTGALLYYQAQINLFRVILGDEMTQGSATLLRYPLGAVAYLKNSSFKGNILVRFGLGEFLYWELYPRFRVSMDGRYEEVYSQQTFLNNDAFYKCLRLSGQGQQASLLAYQSQADFILLDSRAPGLHSLINSGVWGLGYQDQYFTILIRNRISGDLLQKKLPSQNAHTKLGITTRMMSIQDFITANDLKRFKN